MCTLLNGDITPNHIIFDIFWHFSYLCSGCRYIRLTYIRLTALCPGLPRWAGTRKVKPIWILLKQETVSGSGISWAISKSAPRSRQITTPAPHHSVFYRPDALPAAQPTASKHWRHSTEGSGCRYRLQILYRSWPCELLALWWLSVSQVGMVICDLFLNLGSLIISLERTNLDISNLICRLAIMNFKICMIKFCNMGV